MTTPPPPDMSDPGPATAGTPLPRSGSMGWLHLLVVLGVVGAAALFLLSLAVLPLALVPDLVDDVVYVSTDVSLLVHPDQQPSVLEPGVTLSGIDTVTVDPRNPWLFTLAVLARIPSFAVYLVSFVLLLRLVRTARRLDPFTALSARRLRFLGGLLAGGAVAAFVVESIIKAQLFAALTVSRTPVYTWDFPFSAVISGFGLVVVAELLRRGGMMREDLEGTI